MIGGNGVEQDSRAHPALEALQARVEGSATEGIRLALVIEGGGMRGVICGGMVAALEHMGFTSAFHDVIGSSAGAIAGAYFVAGQAAFGTRIFYEEINNRQFVSKRRLLIGKPVVSVDFLLDDVCRGPKLLNWKAVLEAPSRLVCIASNIDREQSVALDRFDGQESLFTALKASARIPAVAGPPVVINGDRHVDAGVYENIPYATALARGATHVVVLMTRPEGKAPATLEWSEKLLVVPWLNKQKPGVGETYRSHRSRYVAEIAAVKAASEANGPPHVISVSLPDSQQEISKIETDRSVLQTGALEGFRAVYSAFGMDPPESPAGLCLDQWHCQSNLT